MKVAVRTLVLPLLLVIALPACSGSRDVTVSGVVAETAATAPSSPIRLEFYEPVDPSDAAASPAPELKLVDTASLPTAGAFSETVSIRGAKLYVVGVVDADGSKGCTDGESWGDAIASIGADDTATVMVNITPQSHCLPMSTPE